VRLSTSAHSDATSACERDGAALCSKALLEEARVPLSLVKERLQTILLKRSSVDVRAAPRLLYVARCMLWDSSERPSSFVEVRTNPAAANRLHAIR
jgi:hypothetical protein